VKGTPRTFLKDHHLRSSDINLDEIIGTFLEDMDQGLRGIPGALRMIPTYIEAENDFLKDVPVLAIDAGGTNFRAAIITISHNGHIETEEILNNRMPGLDGEISSREFFETMSSYLKPLAAGVDRIGFCFSYPTEILPDRDGRLIRFCKEVRAPEVHGQLIGKNLLRTLGTPEKKIVLLNDTVATLLAGKAATSGIKYGTYIGFILGTGTNTCYIEKNSSILKLKDLNPSKSQIINIESGDFGRPPRNETDILFDHTTADPGSYKFEKMFSGGYFGNLVLFILKQAASEGLLSEGAASYLHTITELPASEAGAFLSGNATGNNILLKAVRTGSDKETCSIIIDSLIDRAAKLVAANLASTVIKSGKGKNENEKVLISAEGTTFYKLHNLKSRFEKYFYNYLDDKGQGHIEIISTEHSSLIGAALAGLIK